jgi:V8-like Glu-specific endopeptidase
MAKPNRSELGDIGKRPSKSANAQGRRGESGDQRSVLDSTPIRMKQFRPGAATFDHEESDREAKEILWAPLPGFNRAVRNRRPVGVRGGPFGARDFFNEGPAVERVADTAEFPYRWVGFLRYENAAGRGKRATAWAIAPNVIVTAGHVALHHSEGESRGFRYLPGYDGNTVLDDEVEIESVFYPA